MPKRQLYQCLHAKVKFDAIYCAKGYKLSNGTMGNINLSLVAKKKPLEMTICQDCPDYNCMGPRVKKRDRGWV